MQNARLAGPGAGAEKYDILTALAVKGLSSSGTLQTSILRLVALVTARYNWARGEMAIGQREMAALWSVDERTAKRETRRLIDTGFLVLKVRGVKGRVLSMPLIFPRSMQQPRKSGARSDPTSPSAWRPATSSRRIGRFHRHARMHMWSMWIFRAACAAHQARGRG